MPLGGIVCAVLFAMLFGMEFIPELIWHIRNRDKGGCPENYIWAWIVFGCICSPLFVMFAVGIKDGGR